MALLEPTNLLLLACALIYALIGEPGEELARLSAPRVCLRRAGMDLELTPAQVRVGDTLLLD